MVSYPGTPGTIELLGLRDAVKTIGREYNTLTRYYQYHLSRPAEKARHSHFSLLRTFSGKKKKFFTIQNYLLVRIFLKRWIPLVLRSPVILGKKCFTIENYFVVRFFV